MFEVVATGVNECYGKKGEKRLLNDAHTLTALKRGWITDKFRWVGSEHTAKKVDYEIQLMPFKLINALRTLEAIERRIMRAAEEIKKSNKIVKDLKKLIADKQTNDKEYQKLKNKFDEFIISWAKQKAEYEKKLEGEKSGEKR